MSRFIAGQAFPAEADFEAAKIRIFAASVLSALIGVTLLSIAGRGLGERSATPLFDKLEVEARFDHSCGRRPHCRIGAGSDTNCAAR